MFIVSEFFSGAKGMELGSLFKLSLVAIFFCLAATFAFAVDCNHNGVDDATDLVSGSSDCNLNGIPDDCDLSPVVGFSTPVTYASGDSPFSLIAADLSGDGSP